MTATRNRYPIAEPFAMSRIKLKVPSNANDYINASPIHIGTKRYIAAQGPKSSTINHFYRMIAEGGRDTVVVVMLTRTHENEREKCAQYFPASDEDSPLAISPDEEIGDGFHGAVILESLTEDSSSQSQIRNLRLRATWDGERYHETEIVHLLFEAWPDHGSPGEASRQALVRLIQRANDCNSTCLHTRTLDHPSCTKDSQALIIVHCSAGCGRTGTFIALDHLLSLLDRGELDKGPTERDVVVETIETLRRQRMVMVQSEEQFQFIYAILRERMRARCVEQQA